MTSEDQNIRCEIHRQVARVVLNKPPLDILDIPMIRELSGPVLRSTKRAVDQALSAHWCASLPAVERIYL